MNNEELNKAMFEYLEINRKIKELEDQKETLKAMILVKVKTENIESYDDPEGNRMTYKQMSRRMLDKQLVIDHCSMTGKDVDELMRETTFETLRITSKDNIGRFG